MAPDPVLVCVVEPPLPVPNECAVQRTLQFGPQFLRTTLIRYGV